MREIQIIFINIQKDIAARISDWISAEFYIERVETSDGRIIYFTEDNRICDTAIVLLCDEACLDACWHKNIEELKPTTKIIPVGSTIEVDYEDPDVLPPIVEHINYINPNISMIDEIRDAIFTPENFYGLKNAILSAYNIWIESGKSDSFLLTNAKQLRSYNKALIEKRKTELDPFSIKRLEELIDFTQKSRKQEKKKLARTHIRRIAVFAMVIIFILECMKVSDVSDRYKKSRATLEMISSDYSSGDAMFDALLYAEGIRNASIYHEAVTLESFRKLSNCLDHNWTNPAICRDYEYIITDFCVSDCPEYIWTTDEYGYVTKWNLYTGNYTDHEKLTDKRLIKIVHGRTVTIAIDSEGVLFVKKDGGVWEKNGEVLGYSPSTDTRIIVSDDGKHAVVFDNTHMAILTDDNSLNYSVKSLKAINVFQCDFMNENIIIYRYIEDEKKLCINVVDKYGVTLNDEIVLDIGINTRCSTDIKDHKLLVTDLNNQLLVINPSSNLNNIIKCGYVLSEPCILAWMNDRTIVFYDSNIGTHLYDIELMADLGNVLSNEPIISKIEIEGNMIIGAPLGPDYYCGIVSEDIENLLPAIYIDETNVSDVFDTNNDVYSSGYYRHCSVDHEYLIFSEIMENGNLDKKYIGSYNYGSEIVSDSVKEIKESQLKTTIYDGLDIRYKGKISILGLIDDGWCLIIGTEDGHFYEVTPMLIDSNPKNKYYALITCSHNRIPTHAGISKVYKMKDGTYRLLDTNGVFWFSRGGYEEFGENAFLTAIEKRIRGITIPDAYKEQLSQYIIDSLGIK